MNEKLLIEIVERADENCELAMVPADTLIKFAELIIEECLMICKNYRVHSTNDKKFLAQNEVIFKISDNIEEYFGLK